MTNLAWYAIIITQIVAESLPISSSGHVALLSMIFGFIPYDMGPCLTVHSSWLMEQLRARSVDHFLHGPTFCIVALFFYRRWAALLKCWRRTVSMIAKLILYVGIADAITALFFVARRYIPLYHFPLGAGFIITGLALASLAWCTRQGGKLNVKNAIILGVVQGCAMLPGVSRFATTYAAARWLSLSDRHALETSWMIQMPLIGISFLHSLIIFWQMGIPDQILNLHTAFVMMGASIGGWYALRFAAYVSDRQKMWWFACYMVLPFVVWVFYR
jgi:undecaprenyl-diphosphatase